MRTTLTLEPDVAVQIERLRREEGLTLKAAVNEALRSGLRARQQPLHKKGKFRTRSVSLGRCLIGSLDDVAGALALAEGERFQ